MQQLKWKKHSIPEIGPMTQKERTTGSCHRCGDTLVSRVQLSGVHQLIHTHCGEATFPFGFSESCV